MSVKHMERFSISWETQIKTTVSYYHIPPLTKSDKTKSYCGFGATEHLFC